MKRKISFETYLLMQACIDVPSIILSEVVENKKRFVDMILLKNNAEVEAEEITKKEVPVMKCFHLEVRSIKLISYPYTKLVCEDCGETVSEIKTNKG